MSVLKRKAVDVTADTAEFELTLW